MRIKRSKQCEEDNRQRERNTTLHATTATYHNWARVGGMLLSERRICMLRVCMLRIGRARKGQRGEIAASERDAPTRTFCQVFHELTSYA